MDIKKQGVKLIEAEDFEELSRISAEEMAECIRNKADALICVATGSSPSRAYEILADIISKEKINTDKLRILKLDEWWKVDETDLSTCEHFIQTRIIKPLNIASKNYFGFNSNAEDPKAECDRITKVISEQGPIDLCILGIGKNGHLGLNEPGTYFEPFSHVVNLDKRTRTHAMLKKTNAVINNGITIGIADILASKKILFIAAGDEKEDSFKGFMEGKVRTDLPASVLWLHPNTVCVYEHRLVK